MKARVRLLLAACVGATVLWWLLSIEPPSPHRQEDGAGVRSPVQDDPVLDTSPPPMATTAGGESSRPPLVLRGSVHGWRGAPVDEGRVVLARAEDGDLVRLAECPISSAGRFRIELLIDAPADLALWATSAEEASLQLRLFCTPGETRTVSLYLVPTGPLTVRVVDDRGRPQKGASVRLTCALTVNAPPDRSGSTDGRGECEFVIPLGPCTIRVELASGYRQGLYSESWKTQFRDGLVVLKVPSALVGIPVRVRLPTAETARVHLRWGRRSSLFALRADGSTVVRSFDRARGDGPVAATVRLANPHAEWTYQWPSRKAALGHAGVVDLGPPVIAEVRIHVELRESGARLRNAPLLLRSKEVSCKAKTDTEGIAHTRLPPGEYLVTSRGTTLGRLRLRGGQAEPRLELTGWGLLHLRLEGLEHSEELRLRVRRKPSAELPGRSRQVAREVEVRVSGADQTIAVPWPIGTEVSLQFRKRRWALGAPVDAVVGGPSVVFNAAALEGQPLDIVVYLNLTVARARVGDVKLIPIPSVAGRNPVSAEVDQRTSEARFREVSSGTYEVRFFDRIAERMYVANELLTVRAQARRYEVSVANDLPK